MNGMEPYRGNHVKILLQKLLIQTHLLETVFVYINILYLVLAIQNVPRFTAV